MRSFAQKINSSTACSPLPLFRPRCPQQQVPNLIQRPPSRALRIAPPYLLDDHIPRYTTLSSVSAAKKRSLAHAHLRNCNLCPRRCGVNRLERSGACLIQGTTVRTATIAPHFGEEPCIQGPRGSGAVFFSGCNLRCVFCQNHDVAHTRAGFELSPEELADWMIKLQDVGGVSNINFVTPEHVVPQVVLAILTAKDMGLKVPIVYNTSGYDSLESLELLDGLVDIYLPDFKVWENSTAKRLLKVDNYVSAAKESIKKMWEQVGDLKFTSDGLAKSGVLVRHLVMPGFEEEGKKIMTWLAESVSRDLVVHVMEQYHPRAHVGKTKRTTARKAGDEPEPDVRYSEINRAVTDDEIEQVKATAKAQRLRLIEPAEYGAFYN